MNIAKYCHNKGMNKEEYKNFVSNVKATAKAIKNQLSYKGGMYYPTSDIIKYNANNDMKYFIINELKKLGIEFINNNQFYRVTE